MIVCKECGDHRPEGSAFCGCGAFLEWDGEPVAVEPSGEADTPPAQPAPPAAGAVEPWPTSAQRRAATATAATRSAAAPPVSEQRADQPDADGDIAVRQPQEGTRRRNPRRDDATLPTGTLICGACGAGNDPSRRFCSRCGASLAGAAVVARPPWWRRAARTERTYVAGTRRPLRHRGRLVLRLVLLAALGTAVALLLGPLRPTVVDAYRSTVDALLPPEQVRPGELTADAAIPDHPAALAVDGASNTYWAAPPGVVEVPALRAVFEEPRELVGIGVTGGTSTETPAFLAGPRPAVLEIAVDTPAGPRVRQFTVEDVPGFQRFDLDLPAAREVRISVLRSTGSTPEVATAITELELYARR